MNKLYMLIVRLAGSTFLQKKTPELPGNVNTLNFFVFYFVCFVCKMSGATLICLHMLTIDISYIKRK